MVMANANGEEVRNGRRSRGPSPNGQYSDDESGSDSSEGEQSCNAIFSHRMRRLVPGSNFERFQASCNNNGLLFMVYR